MGKLQKEIEITIMNSAYETEKVELLIKHYALKFSKWIINRDKLTEISNDLWGDFKKADDL